jgi:hypothetical protein
MVMLEPLIANTEQAVTGEQAKPIMPPKPSRDSLGRLLPGPSLNPSGRPSQLQKVKAAFKEQILPSLKKLCEIRDTSKNEKLALAATELLLAYGVGKPKDSKMNDNEPLEIQEVTAQDLQAELDGLA